MNIFKCRLNNKFLDGKWQPWILFLIIVTVVTVVSLIKPIRQWITNAINDNMLLSITICMILFVKFAICRLYYVAKINEGYGDAKGCAGSSCLLTVILGACIVILTVKSCTKNYKPQYDTAPEQIAANDKSQRLDATTINLFDKNTKPLVTRPSCLTAAP